MTDKLYIFNQFELDTLKLILKTLDTNIEEIKDNLPEVAIRSKLIGRLTEIIKIKENQIDTKAFEAADKFLSQIKEVLWIH